MSTVRERQIKYLISLAGLVFNIKEIVTLPQIQKSSICHGNGHRSLSGNVELSHYPTKVLVVYSSNTS